MKVQHGGRGAFGFRPIPLRLLAELACLSTRRLQQILRDGGLRGKRHGRGWWAISPESARAFLQERGVWGTMTTAQRAKLSDADETELLKRAHEAARRSRTETRDD